MKKNVGAMGSQNWALTYIFSIEHFTCEQILHSCKLISNKYKSDDILSMHLKIFYTVNV